MLFGNHDAESEMTRKLDLPDNVRCFAANKPQTFILDTLGVALTQFLDRRRFGWDNRALIYLLTSAAHAAHPPA